MTIDEITRLIREGRYEVSIHAQQERLEDDLDIEEIESAVLQGDLIEDYPTESPRSELPHRWLCWSQTHPCCARMGQGKNPIRAYPQDDHCVYPAASEMDGPSDKRSQAMRAYADCTFCGGEVEERHINYDYRRRDHLLVLRNVPAGVCLQCGEKYFTPDVLRRMDLSFHNIFERDQQPDQVLDVPAVNF